MRLHEDVSSYFRLSYAPRYTFYYYEDQTCMAIHVVLLQTTKSIHSRTS